MYAYNYVCNVIFAKYGGWIFGFESVVIIILIRYIESNQYCKEHAWDLYVGTELVILQLVFNSDYQVSRCGSYGWLVRCGLLGIYVYVSVRNYPSLIQWCLIQQTSATCVVSQLIGMYNV